MEEKALKAMTGWLERQVEACETEAKQSKGKAIAYQQMVDRLAKTCMICGHYSYAEDDFNSHADTHGESDA